MLNIFVSLFRYIFEVFRQINITYESKDIYLNLLDRIVEYLSADSKYFFVLLFESTFQGLLIL